MMMGYPHFCIYRHYIGVIGIISLNGMYVDYACMLCILLHGCIHEWYRTMLLNARLFVQRAHVYDISLLYVRKYNII